MFDTMTITKAGGALCGALLVFLLGNWAAESLYHVGTAGHGDEEHAAGYVIEVETGGGEAEEEVVVDQEDNFLVVVRRAIDYVCISPRNISFMERNVPRYTWTFAHGHLYLGTFYFINQMFRGLMHK